MVNMSYEHKNSDNETFIISWWTNMWCGNSHHLIGREFRRSRTGLPDDDVVGDGGPELVASGTLINALVRLSFLSSADVNHERSRMRLHDDFGVFIDVEMSPVSSPWESGGTWFLLFKAHTYLRLHNKNNLTWDEVCLWPHSGWWRSPVDLWCNPLETDGWWWEAAALWVAWHMS